MAVGRQDYQAGVVPVKSGYSLVQVPQFFATSALVAAGDTYTWTIVTVPAGFQTNVYGIRVSTPSPFSDQAQLIIGSTIKGWWVVNGSVFDNFPPENPITAAATNAVQLKVFNNDEIQKYFYLCMMTILEQIES